MYKMAPNNIHAQNYVKPNPPRDVLFWYDEIRDHSFYNRMKINFTTVPACWRFVIEIIHVEFALPVKHSVFYIRLVAVLHRAGGWKAFLFTYWFRVTCDALSWWRGRGLETNYWFLSHQGLVQIPEEDLHAARPLGSPDFLFDHSQFGRWRRRKKRFRMIIIEQA